MRLIYGSDTIEIWHNQVNNQQMLNLQPFTGCDREGGGAGAGGAGHGGGGGQEPHPGGGGGQHHGPLHQDHG